MSQPHKTEHVRINETTVCKQNRWQVGINETYVIKGEMCSNEMPMAKERRTHTGSN